MKKTIVSFGTLFSTIAIVVIYNVSPFLPDILVIIKEKYGNVIPPWLFITIITLFSTLAIIGRLHKMQEKHNVAVLRGNTSNLNATAVVHETIEQLVESDKNTKTEIQFIKGKLDTIVDLLSKK